MLDIQNIALWLGLIASIIAIIGAIIAVFRFFFRKKESPAPDESDTSPEPTAPAPKSAPPTPSAKPPVAQPPIIAPAPVRPPVVQPSPIGRPVPQGNTSSAPLVQPRAATKPIMAIGQGKRVLGVVLAAVIMVVGVIGVAISISHLQNNGSQSHIGQVRYFSLPSGSSPNAIVTGPDGALWFTDTGANSIGRITTNGAVTEFPVPGVSTVGGGLVAGPDGALWFTAGNNEIGRITTSGTTQIFPIVGSLSYNDFSDDFAIAAGQSDFVWFGINGGIERIATNGQVHAFSGICPEAMTSGPDNAVWFIDGCSGRLGRITNSGQITEFMITGGINVNTTGFYAITSGPDGALWLTAGSLRIERITTAGQARVFYLPGTDSDATDITAGPDGALWFTEGNNTQVGRITTSGQVTDFPLAATDSPPTSITATSITAGPDGAVWFTEMGDPTGKIGRMTTGK